MFNLSITKTENGMTAKESFLSRVEAEDRIEGLKNNKDFIKQFGKPARWLPDFLEGVETKVVIDQEAQEHDQPIYDEQGNEIGTEHVSIPEQSHIEYLHPAEYSYEIEDITAQYEAEQRLLSRESRGEVFDSCCKAVLNYVKGYNDDSNLTLEQINAMLATFADINTLLERGFAKTARETITAIVPDEVLVTTEMKNDMLAIFARYPID